MSRWKDLERTAAKKLGGRRFPRWLDFSQSAPDVLVDAWPEIVIDAKAYRRFAHHGLMAEIERKYCEPGQVPMLVTKHAGQRGEFVTVPLDWLAGLMHTVRPRNDSHSSARKGPVLACAGRTDSEPYQDKAETVGCGTREHVDSSGNTGYNTEHD